MKRTPIRALLLISLLVPALPSPASARAGFHVSGTDLGPDAGSTVCQPINRSGSRLRCDTPDFATSYSGDLTGTISSDFTWTIDCTSRVIKGQALETFTGSVAAVGSGTLKWRTKFHAAFDCSTNALTDLHGTGTLAFGTGALTALHGTLIFTDQTYSGIISRSSGGLNRASSEDRALIEASACCGAKDRW